MFDTIINTPIIEIHDAELRQCQVKLFLKREDLTDPYISGNKHRKLRYNILSAQNQSFRMLLTFGGAFSNHIHAVAYAGHKFGLKTIGIIRGEPTQVLNPTLQDAVRFGMHLKYVSRSQFRTLMEDRGYIDSLKRQYGPFYLIPEGGSNSLAVKGCAEIVDWNVNSFHHVCCAVGTGGTAAGIAVGLNGKSRLWGFPVLKNGGFLKSTIEKLIAEYSNQHYDNWDIVTDYHFGGFAKYNQQLISFINRFRRENGIQLDPIYTGKLIFGIYDLATKGFFQKGANILAIHTGGLQGIRGFNERFGDLIQLN
jgi:1-aminocyclopropane-1-carboxylate deaminase